MDRTNDIVRLCGEISGRPELSHTGRDGNYYKFPLTIRRLSGTEDIINIIISEGMLNDLEITESPRLRVTGEARSFNNRSGVGPRLVITVLARALEFTEDDFENHVELIGSLCKEPNLRRTPMGREICDLMLAVNRGYGRSDYLPCIAWGAVARRCSELKVGDAVRLAGRIQSRGYIKMENDTPVEKTAFEISAVSVEEAEVPN